MIFWPGCKVHSLYWVGIEYLEEYTINSERKNRGCGGGQTWVVHTILICSSACYVRARSIKSHITMLIWHRHSITKTWKQMLLHYSKHMFVQLIGLKLYELWWLFVNVNIRNQTQYLTSSSGKVSWIYIPSNALIYTVGIKWAGNK